MTPPPPPTPRLQTTVNDRRADAFLKDEAFSQLHLSYRDFLKWSQEE